MGNLKSWKKVGKNQKSRRKDEGPMCGGSRKIEKARGVWTGASQEWKFQEKKGGKRTEEPAGDNRDWAVKQKP